jgi:8-oxo-dGTP pyrophosphatase MutT (NUDIX family)
MVREISSGGVVIRRRDGDWWMAAIELPHEHARGVPGRNRRAAGAKPVLALPKGLVDPGEKPLETAIREVYEETGVTADPIIKLGDSKYIYTRTWGDGKRVFKIVSFYLMRYRSGKSPFWARAPWALASPRTWPMPVFLRTCSTSFLPMPTARRATRLPPPVWKLR